MADVTTVLFPTGLALAVYGSYAWYRGSRLNAGQKEAPPSELHATRLRELEQQATARDKALTEVRSELEAANQQLKDAQAKAEAVAEAPRDDAALETLQADRDEARKLLAEAQARVGELESRATELDSQATALKDQVGTWESKATDFESRASALESQLKEAEESAEARLAKLQAMSEKQALELRNLRDKQSRPATAGALAAPTADSAYLSALIDASGDAVLTLNATGEVVGWNPAATALFGTSAEEAYGASAVSLLAPESQSPFRDTLETLRSGAAETQTLDLVARQIDGHAATVEAALARWSDDSDGGPQFLFLLRDTSARQAAEEARRDKEAAEEANRAKSQFLANMSHELRTPLNAIIGFSEILYDRTFGELTPKQERYVSNILSSGRHLLQLINDILDLSKIEAGRVQLDFAAFAPLTAVKTVDNLVKALLQKKSIVLNIESPQSLPPLIADQAKFKQILYNLISNAIKFTPESGQVTVTLAQVNNGSELQVSVTDTGIGIKPEDQARIFREFEQVDSSYARQQQGTGLGLALVSKFVQMHHGKIWVTSEGDGKGSTFAFTVPFAPPAEKAQSPEPPPAEAPAPAPAAEAAEETSPATSRTRRSGRGDKAAA